MNQEALFYIRPDLDVTSQVIVEMDKSFELNAKKLSENEEAPENSLETFGKEQAR